MAGEVRAIEADRLILLAGIVVRIPLGWKLDCDRDHKECRRTRPSMARVTVFP